MIEFYGILRNFNGEKKILVIANYRSCIIWSFNCSKSRISSGTIYLYNFLVTSILGISAFYHDSAAALIIDGKIIAAAQRRDFQEKNMTLDILQRN